MKRALTAFGLTLALVISTMSMAFAYEVGDGSNAANNKNQCENIAGGTYDDSGSVATCTLEFDGEPVIFENAGNSENGWSLAEAGTVVVAKGTGPGTVVSVDLVEECYNPGGKLMKPGSGKCPSAD